MKVLKLSFAIIIFVSNISFGQITAEEKLALMQNSLLLGLEEKGVNVGVEIISLSEFETVKEKALFVLAEYFFSKGIFGNLDETTGLYKYEISYINKAYSFYKKLSKTYPEGEFKDIILTRVEYLENEFIDNVMFGIVNNYLENERRIVTKKLNFIDLFITQKVANPFLFFSEGSDVDINNLIDKYLDDIVVNNKSFAIYAYYNKLLNALSSFKEINIFSPRIEDNNSYNTQVYIYNKTPFAEKITKILNILSKEYPNHPLTIKAYLIAVSYLVKTSIWSYDSSEVKYWLELALKNDNDKLGVKHLVTKEYILKTKFDE